MSRLSALLGALLLLLACHPTPPTPQPVPPAGERSEVGAPPSRGGPRAFVWPSRPDVTPSGGLPGPRAEGSPGDLRLENDALIAIIAAPEHKTGFAASGGNLIDLVTREAPWDELDQLILWLDATWPRQAIYTEVVVVASGEDGDEAAVEARGHESDEPKLRIVTRYSLRRGDRALTVTTAITHTGDQPIPDFELGEAMQWGDTRTFVPGLGFAVPKGAVTVPWLAAEGARTSYAWRPVEDAGPFASLQGTPWSDVTVRTVTLQPGETVQWTRRIAPGASIAAAADPLLTDTPRHTLAGRVTEAGTGAPLPDASLTFLDTRQAPGLPMLRARTGPDGAFQVDLPAGRWTIQAEAPARQAATLELGEVDAPRQGLGLVLSQTAQARFEVREGDRLIPARVTLRGRDGTPTPILPPHPQHLTSLSQVYLRGDDPPLLPIPPGRYTATASRGPEYTTHTQDIELLPGHSPTFAFTLTRVLDTQGWLSADLHQHAAPSPDSRVPLEQRVLTNLAEHVEILVGTDHNVVTDYRPVIARLGVSDHVAGVVGDEVTCALGHFNAFPLIPQPDLPRGGALDPEGLDPAALFAALRALPPEGKLLQVNHPRAGRIGYFDQMKLRPASTTADDPRISWDFDAVELLNGKRTEDALRAMQDWFALLNAGHRILATGNSDTHGTEGEEPGAARNWIHFGHDTPAQVTGDALAQAIRDGRQVVVSNGPLLRARLDDTPIGGTHPLAKRRATLHIDLQAAPWLPLHRVEVIRDGQVIHTFPLDPAHRAPRRLQTTLPLDAARPGWIVLRATGDDPAGDGAPDPSIRPLAFTNPIWIGAGVTPPGP